ncbi:MAG: hypothetical protein LBT41_02680 [Candidatus Methanoplasma sp.]|jgi:KEOPS complex subunit Pcc1|nr:hypothetical protein [Candidatus Methanoplasma sp.]
MHRAVLAVDGPDVRNVIAALSPEAGRELPRTCADMRTEGGVGIVEISAADTSAMRAALNSYLECIRIAEDIGRITR